QPGQRPEALLASRDVGGVDDQLGLGEDGPLHRVHSVRTSGVGGDIGGPHVPQQLVGEPPRSGDHQRVEAEHQQRPHRLAPRCAAAPPPPPPPPPTGPPPPPPPA